MALWQPYTSPGRADLQYFRAADAAGTPGERDAGYPGTAEQQEAPN